MTPEELKRYDGKEGRPAYVAFRGKVYDVSESPLWVDGEHQGIHGAGQDLSDAMAGAPHGDEVFERYPVVAAFEEGENTAIYAASPLEESSSKTVFREWYRRYHPHPATVHFPIALHIFAAGLDLLFFIVPKTTYAAAVFYTFLVATLGGLIAMIAGILSWWVNYSFAMSRPFAVKLSLSVVTLLLGGVAIVVYMEDPGMVYRHSAEGILYHGIVLFTGVSVVVIGYYGGKLTWPSQTHRDDPGDPRTQVSASNTHLPSVSEAATGKETATSGAKRAIAILVGGAAGTGIGTLEALLSDAFRNAGFFLFSTKEYMSRVRGGSNTTLIRIGDAPIAAPCWEVDLFVAIDEAALEHARARCKAGALIIADAAVAAGDRSVVGVDMKKTARELGNPAYANSYAAGVVFGLLGLEAKTLESAVAKRFESKAPEKNVSAAEAGYRRGQELDRSKLPPLPVSALRETAQLHLMNGSVAAGFGFLAGGCNFVASYPMSPSTGVLTFMASMSQSFEIALEQSEDEIAALNMVLGAWYAGARALTTTSGGGFALMGEAVSLAGMTETPAVIYLAQRPGPATGLPTRSEQGDLNLAVHSGHGDFPRIVLAPGNLRECIECGHAAFELADRFQVPVILLSDQYLADSMGMIEAVDFAAFGQTRHIVPTEPDYRRYASSGDGISPRGVPGMGTGRICTVSDEHDERGQITEDAAVRDTMVAKRFRKLEEVIASAHPPQKYGEGTVAVVGWGSSKEAIAEALGRVDDSSLFQLHFSWVHPLNRATLDALRDAAAVVVVENNATGQFARQLEAAGVGVDARVLQSNGFAFFADELAEKIATALKEIS